MNYSNSFNTLNKKDRLDFYVALAVIVAVLSFILYFSFSSISTEDQNPFIDTESSEYQLSDTLIVEGNKYVALEDEMPSNDRVEKLKDDKNVLIAVLSDSTSSSSNYIVASDSVSLENKAIESVPVDTITNTIITDRIDTTIINSGKELTTNIVKVIKNDSLEIEENENEIQNTNSDIDKSCMIAVGLYRNQNNANKMLDRLDKAGYNSSSITRGNKFQIVVYHSCNKSSLNKALKTIRKNFASDAVILVKK